MARCRLLDGTCVVCDLGVSSGVQGMGELNLKKFRSVIVAHGL